MKNITIILCILLLSCGRHAPANTPLKITFGIAQADNPEIFGNWALCTMMEGGQYIYMNACLDVSFNNNGTGTTGRGSVVLSNFTWTLKDGTLAIVYAQKVDGQMFTEPTYFANFQKEDDRMTLEIGDKKEGFSYFLSRR